MAHWPIVAIHATPSGSGAARSRRGPADLGRRNVLADCCARPRARALETGFGAEKRKGWPGAGADVVRCALPVRATAGHDCEPDGHNHLLTLKCRKSGGRWFFLIGIKLPSAPSIYCSLPMNTSLRSSVQLFSVHITVGKRV